MATTIMDSGQTVVVRYNGGDRGPMIQISVPTTKPEDRQRGVIFESIHMLEEQFVYLLEAGCGEYEWKDSGRRNRK